MQVFLYIEVNVLAMAILFLIYFNIRHRTEKYSTDQKLFLHLLYSNAFILVLDSLMWMLDGKTDFWVRPVYTAVTVIYYILSTLICSIWAFYADYQIYWDQRRFKKLFVPMLIPVLVNTVLAIMSIFGNYTFYIDENNIYHRGNLSYVMMSMSFLLLTYTLTMIILKRKRIHHRDFIPMVVFAFPPFIGGIIQCFFYSVSLVWVCMAFSILVVFTNLQNNELSTDHLTGLYNRRQLDSYLRELEQKGISDKLFAGIMIDLDCFKQINDQYGHSAGDQALAYVADLLKSSFRRDDFIARYGGDEFIVILQVENHENLQNTILRLKQNVANFNQEKIVPYSINLSIGVDYFDCQSGMSISQFLSLIDNLMYNDKMNRKSAALKETEV